jgi:hypothetical protein
MRRIITQQPSKRPVEVVALDRIDMHHLANLAGGHTLAAFLPARIEQLVVPEAHAQAARFGDGDDVFRVTDIHRERLFDVHVRASGEALTDDGMVRVRRGGDVHDIRPYGLQHVGDVVEDAVDVEARGRLPREIEMPIAHRDNRGGGHAPQLLQMRVGNLPAADQRDVETRWRDHRTKLTHSRETARAPRHTCTRSPRT